MSASTKMISIVIDLWLAILALGSMASTNTTMTNYMEDGRHIIKLHRQKVPVAGEGNVVTYKTVYFGSIFLGEPKPQEFSMVFDTGSGYIIVPSMMCKTKACTVHRRYNKYLSETSLDVDHDGTAVKKGQPRDQITLTFGTGEIVGQFADDWLCLTEDGHDDEEEEDEEQDSEEDGGHSADQDTGNRKVEAQVDVQGNALLQQKPPSLIPNKTVIEEEEDHEDNSVWGKPIAPDCMTVRLVMATKMSPEPFQSFTFDGVLGLGMSSLALVPEFSFFTQMHAQRMVTHPSFGIFLAEGTDDFSEISFGGHNPRRLQNNVTHVPVVLPELGYWQVKINSIRVGGKKLDFCDDGTCRAVADSGTSLLAVPKLFAPALQQELKGKIADPPNWVEGVTSGCKGAIGPEIEFELEVITLVLVPGDYTRQAHSIESLHKKEAQNQSEKAINTSTNTNDNRTDSVMMQTESGFELGIGLSVGGGTVAAPETMLMQQGGEIGIGLSLGGGKVAAAETLLMQGEVGFGLSPSGSLITIEDSLLIQQGEETNEQAPAHHPDEDMHNATASVWTNATAKNVTNSTINATNETHSVSTMGNWQMDNSKCRPALMAIEFPPPLGPKMFILGEPVLRKYYTEYNSEKKTVGFGLAYHEPEPVTSEKVEFV